MERNSVLTVLAVAALPLIGAGCGKTSADQSGANDSLARENAQLTQRIATVEANLLAAQKELIAEQQNSEELRQRVAAIEAQLSKRPAPPSAAQTAAPPPPPAVRTEPRPTRTDNRDKPAPSWNDVSRASDFYDANNVIQHRCSAEWPSNARGFNSCVKKQTDAVMILKQGRPFGEDEAAFNEARVRCATESPSDYAMRLRCESKARR